MAHSTALQSYRAAWQWLMPHCSAQGLGTGLRLLSLFRCQDALAAFQRLPLSQRNTGDCPDVAALQRTQLLPTLACIGRLYMSASQQCARCSLPVSCNRVCV